MVYMVFKRLKKIILMSLFAAFLAVAPFTYKPAQAGAVVAPSVCTNCPVGSPTCVLAGTTELSVTALLQFMKEYLENMINDFTEWFKNAWDNLIAALLEFMDSYLEGNFMTWQDNLWAYDWRPALQDMMGQLNTAMVDQSRVEASFATAEAQQYAQQKIQEKAADAQRETRPSESVCQTGTVMGGAPRAHYLGRIIRQASENDLTALLTNKEGTPGAKGPLDAMSVKWERYCTYLVDENNNGGDTGCPDPTASPVETRNADVKSIEFLFNNYSIDVSKPEVAAALTALKENLVADVPPSTVPPEAITGGPGQEALLANRSYIARKLAARSTIEYVASSRLPIVERYSGDDLNDYIESIKVAAGNPLSGLPEKFSYRDLMHAMSVEKFATGQYNLEQIDEIENVEREALTLSIFYLMQLREKFEIMERGIMALAIQTAIEIDREFDSSGGSSEALVSP